MNTAIIAAKSEVSSPTVWTVSEKILFRFFFCYFFLYILPFPFDRFPFTNVFSRLIYALYDMAIPLVGELVFNITDELARPGGSGDTTYNYLQLFLQLGVAVLFSLVWTAIDWNRSSYRHLYKLILVFLRYFLGLTMLQYGMSKIFVHQFSDLSLFDLIKPYGESSPMGLMWNFMEYSSTYTIFSGLAEFVGGMLLFFRRTTKLGALMIFAVMLNVFLMNMSYDIPVKLFSFHLMLMAVFILVPSYKELVDFFIRNRPTLSRSRSPYFQARKWNIAANVLKGMIVLHALIVVISNNIRTREEWGSGTPLPPLYGIYEVQDFVLNQDTLAPLTTDQIRWNQLIIDKHNGGIVNMERELNYVGVEVDTIKTHLQLSPYGVEETYEMQYELEDGRLILKGKHDEDDINVILKRKDEKDFPLVKRGFNWVNEYPNNM